MPAPTLDPSLAGLPRQLGKYALVRKLATGGMAELFLAIQRSVGGFEKLLVIKRILPSMNQDRAFIEMLLHEARIAATLSHPNIVQVFDVGMIDGAYFIAMEHAHGEDLRAIVRQMKSRQATEFPMEHALSIVLGVCAGLAYAHAKLDLNGAPLNIVHRDVSPQNVIVTFSGDVKLVDFGIAKSDARPGEETESGRLKGKVPYMSPEQARGEPVDWRSDIFAVGVILFELTTGRRLFKATSEYETLKLICEREYPLPSVIRPGYPPALEAIVMRALARDRDERWQSAREMQGAVEEFVRQGRIGASRTGLSKFVSALFADKLLNHAETLLQEKQLADTIAVDALNVGGDVNGGGVESLRPSTYGPMASRTITDARVPNRARLAAVLGTLGLLALVGTASGEVLSWGRHASANGAAGANGATPGNGSTPGNGVASGNGVALPIQEHAATRTEATPPRQHGVIAIASVPPGAAIFVNGELSRETTPVTLSSVTVGAPCAISVRAAGFDPVTQVVTLTDDDPSAAISVVLPRSAPHKR